MKLVLVRHGEAERLQTTDAERALTAAGREQAAETARWLAKQPLLAEAGVHLLCSTYRRARETAHVMAEALGATPRVIDHITPDDDPRLAWRSIDLALKAMEPAEDDAVIVVSHMPLVAALSAWLEEGVVSPAQGFSLAEARLLSAEIFGPGSATVKARFVPGLS